MPQSIFPGSTDYRDQSIEEILSDLAMWINMIDRTFDLVNPHIVVLESGGHWRRVSFASFLRRCLEFLRRSRSELTEIAAEIPKQIQPYHVSRLTALGNVAHDLDLRLGEEWHREVGVLANSLLTRLSDEEFHRFEIIYAETRDTIVTLLDLSNVGHRLKDFEGHGQSACVLRRKVKVLFIAANPRSTDMLALDEEVRAIQGRIQASDYRDSLEFITRWAARPLDLLQEINLNSPDVIHFSGHGSLDGELILVDDAGGPRPVKAEALTSLMKSAATNTQVVLFNTCSSSRLARAVTDAVDVAIGMKVSIGDDAARVFAASFYSAIGFGRSILNAFDQGRTALLLEDIHEEDTPEIYTREGISADDIHLV